MSSERENFENLPQGAVSIRVFEDVLRKYGTDGSYGPIAIGGATNKLKTLLRWHFFDEYGEKSSMWADEVSWVPTSALELLASTTDRDEFRS